MVINLQDFMVGYRTHQVVFWDKKWVFREPSIRTLLSIKSQEWAEQLLKEILIEGSYEELDEALGNFTIEKREEFYQSLLKELGLK